MNFLNRKKAPPIQEFASFSLIQPSEKTLVNGIKLKVFDNQQLDLLHFIIRVKAGAFYESEKNISSFCYSLLKESSGKYSSNEVDAFLDYYGAMYEVTVMLEYVNISIMVPHHNCLEVLSYILDFLLYPHFNPKNLEIFRQRRIKNLEYNNKKTSYLATQWMFRNLFGESLPIGIPLTKEHLEKITISQLTTYHQNSFYAENIRVFMAGNIGNELLDQIASILEQIPENRNLLKETPFLSPHLPEPFILDRLENSLQSSLMICKRFIDYTDPDRRPFSVVATLLGGYFGSRLMQNLREKNGFTYGVHCGLIYLHHASICYVESEVNVDKTSQALKECLYEMEQLGQNWVEDEELELVKNYMRGTLLREVESTPSYMKKYMIWDDFNLNKDEFQDMMNMIQTVDKEDIKKLSEKYLSPDSFSKIIVGNKEDDKLY
ncbi:MAG: pitrilysin family protein [Bacteroidales bacterium]